MDEYKDVDQPIAYFITFHTYGTWLPGDRRGSVDTRSNQFDTEYLPCDIERYKHAKNRMKYPPYLLDANRRIIVLKSIKQLCKDRQWELYAAHIRSNHVHCVLNVSCSIEQALTELKSGASRQLNLSGCDIASIRRWVKHGSTRYLWDAGNVLTAIHYVVEQQGEPMAWYKNDLAYNELCSSIDMLEY